MPHILHRTWYINVGNMPRERAQQFMKDQRDRIMNEDVLPHGVSSIDYFLPVTGSQPTHVDVLVIPTDIWEPVSKHHGMAKPLGHSPETEPTV